MYIEKIKDLNKVNDNKSFNDFIKKYYYKEFSKVFIDEAKEKSMTTLLYDKIGYKIPKLDLTAYVFQNLLNDLKKKINMDIFDQDFLLIKIVLFKLYFLDDLIKNNENDKEDLIKFKLLIELYIDLANKIKVSIPKYSKIIDMDVAINSIITFNYSNSNDYNEIILKDAFKDFLRKKFINILANKYLNT